MSDAIIRDLTSVWLGSQAYNRADWETYYYGQQTARGGMLTSTQADREDIKRFWRPINYTATVVDEPIGYLANGRIRITSSNEILGRWGNEFFERRIRPQLNDLIRWQGLYGENFLYFWTDQQGYSRGLKADVVPPIEAGVARVLADYGGQDPEELTSAVIFKRTPVDSDGAMDEYRITLEPDRILVEKRRISTHNSPAVGGRWEVESDERNPARALPLVPCFNPTPSDILDFLPVQDDLDKLHLDLRLTREYHGFPMLATDRRDVQDLEVGAGRILFGGDFRRLDPPSLDALLSEREILLEDGAMIARSLALANRSGGDLSGVALRFLQQNFESRLNAKAQRLASCLELALRTAARIVSSDTDLLRQERPDAQPTAAALRDAVFQVEVEPVIPADEKANAETAAIWFNQLLASQETALGKAGVEDPAREVEKAQTERQGETILPTPGDGAEDDGE